MVKFTTIAILIGTLTACSPQTVYVTKFVKPIITNPGLPILPEKCAPANYVLLEYKGTTMVAEPMKEKLARLECDSDKVRYTKELLNTIHYFEEVTK
jgi:hypothetical protein